MWPATEDTRGENAGVFWETPKVAGHARSPRDAPEFPLETNLKQAGSERNCPISFRAELGPGVLCASLVS